MKFILVLTLMMSTSICFSQINLIKKASIKAESIIKKDVKLSESEIIDGLTEALKRGCSFSVNVSSAEGGFNNNQLIKIPFPDEYVKNKLSNIGFSDHIKQFEKSMNRSAEIASEKALPVLEQALSKMSINDALTILNGEDNAATFYLKNNTHEFLYSEFKPMIVLAMEKVDIANKWNPLIKKYNAIPFTKKLNPDLEDYITKKTIDGLFILIAEQEKEIRTNPEARVTDLLIKIFK
ncbi:MAG: hypothetical protein CMD22_00195 [Flavobacteriales bacterium]|mgnify:FL=1|nr:hypothetical protein [Flavobacteriales bacterium]|tara:strand:+ start:5807 stop:6517 length:711 start_codon:yes stop_codon:yes gene_type:complete